MSRIPLRSIVVFYLLLVLVLAACGPTGATETVTVVETVQVVVTAEPAQAEPGIAVKTSNDVLHMQIISEQCTAFSPFWDCSMMTTLGFHLLQPGLLFPGPEGSVGQLAESWEVSDDATSVTFHLHENTVWDDGTPLTANDIAFTYQTALHPAVGQGGWESRYKGIKGADAYIAGEADNIEGIVVVDDHTITFELAAPDVSIVPLMRIGVVPAHAYEGVAPEDILDHPFTNAPTIASGPYRFVRFEPAQFIELEANPNYWGEPAKIQRVFLHLVEDITALAQLEAGELDIVGGYLDVTEVERMEALPHITVASESGWGIYALYANGFKDDLKDKRVRQAIMYAIDRESVLEAAFEGRATEIDSTFWGAAGWASPDDLNPYDYDPDKAKELLEEIGWDSERELKLQIINTTGPDPRLAAVVQQNLADVGMRVTIKTITPAYLLPSIEDYENWDIGLVRGGRFPIDPNVSQVYFTSGAFWNDRILDWNNNTIDALFAEGVQYGDQAQRQEVYFEIARIINDELPWMILAAPDVLYMHNKGLKGVVPTGNVSMIGWNLAEWEFGQ